VAAGPRRRNSLSEVEILPWLCCMTPALLIFGIYLSVLFTSFFSTTAFYYITAVLTTTSVMWVSNGLYSATLGFYRLRKACAKDWQKMLENLQEDDPEASEVLHIVILPNFQENENMLKETLENVGLSPLAPSRIRVVLAMEAREGPEGREKADRLIQQTQHLFADIFATYHPTGLPGEVAGKSSNTQWAFRSALRHYGPILMGVDLSRVFVTVGDADTLWHPQYFSALTYQALTTNADDRIWKIWQPPILLLRNIFSVPAMTRASAHATLIFELGSMSDQNIFPAFAYSAYTLSLALVSHPEVDGWDTDVIAEDHHMFLKCYFASIWELVHLSTGAANGKGDDNGKKVAIRPRVEIEPVYLPAVSYLVESSDGYMASWLARFQQARRHSQGVVELGYVLLQYCRLVKHMGMAKLPAKCHIAIIRAAVKIHVLHIISTAQCFSLIMAALTSFIPTARRFLMEGGMTRVLQLDTIGAELASGFNSLSGAQQAMLASVSQISGVTLGYSFVCLLVILDLIEGRYYRNANFQLAQGRGRMTKVEEEEEDTPPASTPSGDQDAEEEPGQDVSKDSADSAAYPGVPAYVTGPLTILQKIGLGVQIFYDTAFIGYQAIACYAMIPVLMAGWSLFRRGTDFEYIVAEKPT